ncbi:hypothetical protein FRC19_001709 [Serendipita sp. 401]|nr:hypothetical protein FRC19_001709 [Serendipita sp. 401]KAG9045864.1 hypothetical protein FS842_001070 [Serendipita sp. 407]
MDTLKDQATDSSASSGSGSLEYTFTDYLEESGLLKDLTVQQINAASDALVKRATGKPTKSAALVAVHIDTVMRNKGMTVVEENNRIRYVTLCQIMTEGGQFKTFTVNKPPSLDACTSQQQAMIEWELIKYSVPPSPPLRVRQPPTKIMASFKALNEYALIWPVWQDPSKLPTFVMAYCFINGVPKADHFAANYTFKGGYDTNGLQTVDFAWRLTQYCSYNPSEPDEVGEERFIFVGYTKDPKTTHSLQGCYMRLVDLQIRLGVRDEKRILNDLQLLKDGKALYPLWKPDGQLLTGSYWPNRFKPMDPRDSDDSIIKERRLFFEHCKVAHVARISEGLYDVLSRFWDGQWEPELILQIDPIYKQKIRGTASDDMGLMESIEKIKKFWLFAPEIKIVWDKPSSTGLREWGRHPNSLYILWMDSTAYSKVEHSTTPGVWLPPRAEPDSTQLAAGNKKIEDGISDTGSGTYVSSSDAAETTTTVTQLSISTVRNFKRTPDQIGAMGKVSPNVLVGAWWNGDGPKEDKVAEWLHRSAWSYGGLATGGKMDPQTSQTMSNLIIGTHETNTMMIRYEIFVKRLAHYTNLPVTVVTIILNEDLITRPTYAWCCSRLRYVVSTPGPSTFPVNFSVVFEPFSRRLPTRFELDLDELLESLAYGWKDSSFMAQQ